jgi:hypothetical protein
VAFPGQGSNLCMQRSYRIHLERQFLDADQYLPLCSCTETLSLGGVVTALCTPSSVPPAFPSCRCSASAQQPQILNIGVLSLEVTCNRHISLPLLSLGGVCPLGNGHLSLIHTKIHFPFSHDFFITLFYLLRALPFPRKRRRK